MKKEHLEVILEDISSKFDLVLEGHASLDKKIDARFDELSEKIENNSFKIDGLANSLMPAHLGILPEGLFESEIDRQVFSNTHVQTVAAL